MPTLAEFIEAVQGRPLTYVERCIADKIEVMSNAHPPRMLLKRRQRRIVPHALTDVHRRGGKGTP